MSEEPRPFTTAYLIDIHGEETCRELETWLDNHQVTAGIGVLFYIRYNPNKSKLYGTGKDNP